MTTKNIFRKYCFWTLNRLLNYCLHCSVCSPYKNYIYLTRRTNYVGLSMFITNSNRNYQSSNTQLHLILMHATSVRTCESKFIINNSTNYKYSNGKSPGVTNNLIFLWISFLLDVVFLRPF